MGIIIEATHADFSPFFYRNSVTQDSSPEGRIPSSKSSWEFRSDFALTQFSVLFTKIRIEATYSGTLNPTTVHVYDYDNVIVANGVWSEGSVFEIDLPPAGTTVRKIELLGSPINPGFTVQVDNIIMTELSPIAPGSLFWQNHVGTEENVFAEALGPVRVIPTKAGREQAGGSYFDLDTTLNVGGSGDNAFRITNAVDFYPFTSVFLTNVTPNTYEHEYGIEFESQFVDSVKVTFQAEARDTLGSEPDLLLRVRHGDAPVVTNPTISDPASSQEIEQVLVADSFAPGSPSIADWNKQTVEIPIGRTISALTLSYKTSTNATYLEHVTYAIEVVAGTP